MSGHVGQLRPLRAKIRRGAVHLVGDALGLRFKVQAQQIHLKLLDHERLYLIGVDVLRAARPGSNGWKKARLAINIAIDEGETWLMADRKGFSQYFGIKSSLLPVKQAASLELSDSIPYKTSLYFLNEIVPHTNKKKVREVFACMRPGRKPPTYNNLWPDFIENYWNIDEAVKNSRSLQRAVQRVQIALQKCP